MTVLKTDRSLTGFWGGTSGHRQFYMKNKPSRYRKVTLEELRKVAKNIEWDCVRNYLNKCKKEDGSAAKR